MSDTLTSAACSSAGPMVRCRGFQVRHVLFLIAVLLTSASVSAERPRAGHNLSAEVDSAVRQQMRQQRIPGIGVSVVLNGRIIKAKGYGLANVELGTPVSPNTMFEAGSI